MSNLPLQVKKRDGRIVPFDMRKIAEAIAKAFVATGEGDIRLATELADVVTMALSRRGPRKTNSEKGSVENRWVPSIEEIQDLVERVLMETGYTQTAKSYILYRDKRSQLRELVSVRDNETPTRSTNLQVQGSKGESQGWSKGRIVAALINEADLPRETAEAIASRVEKRVFESGIRRLSTSLIRELVDNELFEMGLESKRRRQTMLGIPKFDLGQLLKSGLIEQDGATQVLTQDPGSAAAQWLIERYALEEVLPPEVMDIHRDGGLHFADLSQIHREFSVSIRFGEKLSAQVQTAAQQIATETVESLASTSSYLYLEGVDTYWERCAEREQFEQALFDRLSLLRQTKTEVVLSIANNWEPKTKFPISRPLSYAEGSWIGPGLSRAAGEETHRIACGAIGSVNLPRLMYETGRWGDSKFLPALVERLEMAVGGLLGIMNFQKQLRFARGRDTQFSRVSYAISLEGLVEAVRFSREGSFDPDLARTIRTVASDFLRDLSLRNGLSMSLEEFSLREAATRFARLDYERFQQSHELLAPESLSYHSQEAVNTLTAS